MLGNAQGTAKRNRSDHVLPQGYLDGFTSPSSQGQLCVFDCQQQRWFDTGTPGVGAIGGFYDYSLGSQPDQTADQAFTGLEARFPAVRRELVGSRFSGWMNQLNFLLAFAQMLRARSKLFREQDVAHARRLTMFEVEEVLEGNPSETYPGKLSETWRIRPYEPASETEDEMLLRNKAITDMRTEIARGPAWLAELYWCLRFTVSPADPVITSDNPIVIDGRAPTLEEALRDTDTLVFFPVCWQACLIGSTARFDKGTEAFHLSDLGRLHRIYLESADRFIFSPARIESWNANTRARVNNE